MSERIVEKAGGTYIERDKPGHPGVVEFELIGEGVPVIRAGGTVEVIERGSVSTSSRATWPPSDDEITPLPDFYRERPLDAYVVSLDPFAQGEMEREAANVWRDFDTSEDLETGGFLYDFYRPSMERAAIVYASGPGPRSRHARNALELSGPEDCEREFSEWVPRERLVRVGMWHSHPNGGATPSRADLRAWRAGLELTGLDAYLGAIVTPSAHYGYRAGDVHVYVARHDGDGGVYVEPARVE